MELSTEVLFVRQLPDINYFALAFRFKEEIVFINKSVMLLVLSRRIHNDNSVFRIKS